MMVGIPFVYFSDPIGDIGRLSCEAYKRKMPDEPSAIPLADVLCAANELVSAGIIKDYALGGAFKYWRPTGEPDVPHEQFKEHVL